MKGCSSRETARFKRTVDPAPFVPDADITWIPLSGNHVSYDDDHGRIFEAEAVSTGAQTLTRLFAEGNTNIVFSADVPPRTLKREIRVY